MVATAVSSSSTSGSSLTAASNRTVPLYDPSKPQDMMRWGIAVKAWFDIEGRAKNMPLKDVLEQPKGA